MDLVWNNTNLQGNSNDKLGPVPTLEKISERVLYFFGYTTSLNKLQELRFNLVSAPNLSEHGLPFFETTAFNKTIRSVCHQEGSHGQESGRNASQAQWYSPTPLAFYAVVANIMTLHICQSHFSIYKFINFRIRPTLIDSQAQHLLNYLLKF